MTASVLVPAVVLAAAWAGFVGLAVVTRRPVDAPLPDRAGYLAGWSALHGSYDPTAGPGLVVRWLSVVDALARPLARRGVLPDVLTLAGVLATGTATAVAAGGSAWPLLAALVLVVGGVLDNIDGAVAVLTRRATSFGSVLDSVTDRVADTLGVVALGCAGAPAWTVLAGVGAPLLQEYTRARAGVAGMHEIGVVTIGERPTRVIVAAVALVFTGVLPGHAAWIAGAGALATAIVCGIGFVQFTVAARRALAGLDDAPDETGDDPSRQQHQGQPPTGV